MQQPIISNDLHRVYVKHELDLVDRTILVEKASTADVDLYVANNKNLAINSIVVIGNFYSETSEIVSVKTINGVYDASLYGVAAYSGKTQITLNSGIVRSYERGTAISIIDYDTVKVYVNGVLAESIAIAPEAMSTFYITTELVDTDYVEYTMYNTLRAIETPRSEKAYVYSRLLCNAGDVFQFENIEYGVAKLVDKISIATRDIQANIKSQGKALGDIVGLDGFRTLCVYRTLYYVFTELSKNKDDIATFKAEKYLNMYNKEISPTTLISNQTSPKAQIIPQARVGR